MRSDGSDSTPIHSPDKLNQGSNIQTLSDGTVVLPLPDTGGSGRSRRDSMDGSPSKLNFDQEDKDSSEVIEAQSPPIPTRKGVDTSSDENMPKTSTYDSVTKQLQSPAAQFLAGELAGKAFVAPTLRIATDYMNNQNSNKPITSYYSESIKGVGVGLLKAATQFSFVTFTPSKFAVSPIEKQLAAKISTDVMFASAEAMVYQQVKSLQKLVSGEYAKELSIWTIMGIQQIPGLKGVSNVIDFNNLYAKAPAVLGAVAAIGPELIDFSTAVYTKVYGLAHDYFAGDHA